MWWFTVPKAAERSSRMTVQERGGGCSVSGKLHCDSEGSLSGVACPESGLLRVEEGVLVEICRDIAKVSIQVF